MAALRLAAEGWHADLGRLSACQEGDAAPGDERAQALATDLRKARHSAARECQWTAALMDQMGPELNPSGSVRAERAAGGPAGRGEGA